MQQELHIIILSLHQAVWINETLLYCSYNKPDNFMAIF